MNMPHQTFARFAWLLAVCAFGASCDKPSSEKNAPAAATTQSAPVPSSGSSEKTAAASAAPSAFAAPEIPVDATLVGTWEGSYDAKKGEVEMPSRVKDKVRSKDDGKMAIGAGTIKLVINKDNELEGTAEGALGASSVRGKVEGDEVRAQFFPTNPLDKQAMFGIVSGKRKDDRIDARIRVANGDASVVREADIVLRKKP